MVRRMSARSSLPDELRSLLGEAAVITNHDRMGAYLREPRKRFRVPAAAVAVPADVEQVQTLVRWANERRVGLIRRGQHGAGGRAGAGSG